MKHIYMIVAILFAGTSLAQAQTESNPWAIEIGINAIDVHSVGEPTPQGELFHEFFNVNDHWNIVPAFSYVSVSRYLGSGFSAGITASMNKITKWGQIEDDDINSGNFPGPRDVSVEVDDLLYLGVDAQISFSFGRFFNRRIEPFITAGGGYTWIEEGPYNTFSDNNGIDNLVGAGTVNGSAGLRYWLNEKWGFSLQSKYKHAFKDYLTTHFQHSLGVVYNFGGNSKSTEQDTDKDGIEDQYDLCPETPGLEAFNGCPDTDGDGISDAKDECPEIAGILAFNGCPDTDGDGVADTKDHCPEKVGSPDNNGCPWLDSDQDGVLDKDDKCIMVKGSVANNGCPEAELTVSQVEQMLKNYNQSINFDTGKSTFKSDTYSSLQSIIKIMNDYPKANFRIEGHTDSVGTSQSNQLLSVRRANAVKDYLVTNGISAKRLSVIGYGENQPIESNSTSAGRAQNRRVEIKSKN